MKGKQLGYLVYLYFRYYRQIFPRIDYTTDDGESYVRTDDDSCTRTDDEDAELYDNHPKVITWWF